ncbi:MAG: hypothetical protein GX590_05035 [Lentisphaerae bacterium]|nr:hypothetical protein [Lentisphaerota bacterium]
MRLTSDMLGCLPPPRGSEGTGADRVALAGGGSVAARIGRIIGPGVPGVCMWSY